MGRGQEESVTKIRMSLLWRFCLSFFAGGHYCGVNEREGNSNEEIVGMEKRNREIDGK